MKANTWQAQTRDFQRQRVYDGERIGFMHNFEAHAEPQMSLRECRIFVARVVKSKHWTSRTDITHINVKEGRGCIHARARFHRIYSGYVLLDVCGEIVLPKWSRNKQVILHELAHIIAEGDQHGAYFTEQYVALVSRFMGREAAKKLREDFKHFGVQPYGTVNKGDRCQFCATLSYTKFTHNHCEKCASAACGLCCKEDDAAVAIVQ